MARTISIVGAGRVGQTLARRLRQLGWRIGAVVTQSKKTSQVAARAIGGGTPHSRLTRDALRAEVLLITTPDGALERVARALANFPGENYHSKIALHTSGALDRRALAPLARRGVSTGSLHPMQTFSGRGTPQLKGVIFAVEGDRAARRTAQAIARALGGVPVAIHGKSKPAYHAAGALVAGHGLALVEAATRTLTGLGFSRRRALQALLPLIRQMLDNYERLGPQAAWTGPISRGDYATIAKHGAALRRYPREFNDSYAALSLLAARVLSKKPAATRKKLLEALKNSRGGSR
ncbi:MAG TPA: DUF2520 domain-containing protein [Candidatus Limnocylindria bacterium]|nr:DUF2520 domain-containing protein [Candidatus Limnocylindria bacterium]